MADIANVLAHRLEQRLVAAGNAAMSSKMEAYMKGNFKMAGVYSTERKLHFGEWYADNKTEIQHDLRAVAKALYQSPFR